MQYLPFFKVPGLDVEVRPLLDDDYLRRSIRGGTGRLLAARHAPAASDVA
jgi:hypothetical protein